MLRIVHFKIDETNVRKSVKILFTFLHIFFTFDFGYIQFSSHKANLMLKFATFVQCVSLFAVCSIYYFQNTDGVFLIWSLSISFQYLCNSIVLLLFGRENSFCKLQENLTSIDYMLGVESDRWDRIMVVGYVFGMFTKILMDCVYCFGNPSECLLETFSTLFTAYQTLSQVVIVITFVFVFHSVYWRLNVLIEYVKSTNRILHSLKMYRDIADAIGKPNKYFGCLHAFTFITKLPDMIVTTYLGLLKANKYGMMNLPYEQIVRYIYITYMFIVVCLPALCAGVVTSATHRLELTLHDRLLIERDSMVARHIQLFSQYMRARPLSFTMIKVVPLDWRLPVIVINICISYQIVIVQFTKIY